MVASADGRATLGGRTEAISSDTRPRAVPLAARAGRRRDGRHRHDRDRALRPARAPAGGTAAPGGAGTARDAAVRDREPLDGAAGRRAAVPGSRLARDRADQLGSRAAAVPVPPDRRAAAGRGARPGGRQRRCCASATASGRCCSRAARPCSPSMLERRSGRRAVPLDLPAAGRRRRAVAAGGLRARAARCRWRSSRCWKRRASSTCATGSASGAARALRTTRSSSAVSRVVGRVLVVVREQRPCRRARARTCPAAGPRRPLGDARERAVTRRAQEALRELRARCTPAPVPARARPRGRPRAPGRRGSRTDVALAAEVVGRLGAVLEDGDHVRPGLPELLVGLAQLGEVLTAERSPEMAHEGHHQRPVAPALGERHVALARTRRGCPGTCRRRFSFAIGAELNDCHGRLPRRADRWKRGDRGRAAHPGSGRRRRERSTSAAPT